MHCSVLINNQQMFADEYGWQLHPNQQSRMVMTYNLCVIYLPNL